ncbi:phage head-binding domain-containing protein [Xenorhabdus bovienii]|uniref:phage head-binding domain-containing protein n=1 Tax=Xenorhabdus bovienii TaxID=40576 RepID=UPI000697CAE7|nr:phage head-binding domain-containing protein [Xenorhabdus bovienii]
MSEIIPNVVVSMPSQLFTMARSFKACSNGMIYIGKIDTDPTIPENRIQVYVERENGDLIPASQPIIINAAGYPVYVGQIAKFVTVEGHSMAVYDSYGTQQFYFPNILKYEPDRFEQRLKEPGGASIIGESSGGSIQNALDAPCIYVYKYIDGMEIDHTDILQKLQNKSEKERKPLNFVNVRRLIIDKNIYYQKYLVWYSTSYSDTSLYFTNTNRDQVNGKFIYKINEGDSIDCFIVKSIHFDFGNKKGGLIPIPELIQGITVISRGDGVIDKDIYAIDCRFTNPRGDCLRVQTWDGAKAKNANMINCIGDVNSLNTASWRANMFRTFNGEEHAPGSYGVYTISDVSMIGGSCRGFRSMSDFKRGTEFIFIEGTYTEDISDCHHSVDGVREFTFGSGNRGRATSANNQMVKNYLEVQGINVDIDGGSLLIDDDATLNMTGGFFITQYAYPVEERANPGIGHPSVNVKIKGGTFNKIGNHAVRLINSINCSVENVTGKNILHEIVAFEYIDGRHDNNGNKIIPYGNYCDRIKAIGSRSCILLQYAGVYVGRNISNNYGEYSVYNYQNGFFRAAFTHNEINDNPYLLDYSGKSKPLFWHSGIDNEAIYSQLNETPLGYPSAISLEDDVTTFLKVRNYSKRIPIKNGGIIYFKTCQKSISGTPQSAIIIRLYDVLNNILKIDFIGITLTSTWSDYYRSYTVDTDSASYCEIAITPGSYDNSPSKIGKIGIAVLNVSRTIIG